MDIDDKKYTAAFEKLGYRFPSKGQLKHIRHSHYTDGAKYRYNVEKFGKAKSVFNLDENFIEIALQALQFGHKQGEYEITYDCGRIIGLTRDGLPTSKVLLILNRIADSIVSIYPI